MNQQDEPIYVKKTELAKALGVSSRTIDNWVARQLIPYLAISPRLHLFNLEEVKAALQDSYGVRARGR